MPAHLRIRGGFGKQLSVTMAAIPIEYPTTNLEIAGRSRFTPSPFVIMLVRSGSIAAIDARS
jgi:hypothetical protein